MADFTIDPWTQSLIDNRDMIMANVSNGMDRGGVLVVEVDENGKLGATWKEVMQSMIAGKLIVVREMQFADATATVRFGVLTEAGFEENTGWYILGVAGPYYADSVDDAPVLARP